MGKVRSYLNINAVVGWQYEYETCLVPSRQDRIFLQHDDGIIEAWEKQVRLVS